MQSLVVTGKHNIFDVEFPHLKVKGVKNPLIMNSSEDRTQCMQDTTSENGREVGIPEAQTMRETQHTENLWVNYTRAKMMVEIYLPGEKAVYILFRDKAASHLSELTADSVHAVSMLHWKVNIDNVSKYLL